MHVQCRNSFLRLSILNGFQGRFDPKKAVLGHKMCDFGRAPPELAPAPWGATGEFLAQNLDWQGHHLSSKMARVE